MGRHKKSIERPCVPDVKYNSTVITKFISRMMLDGKKSICTKIIYEALDKLKTKTDKDPLEVFLKAVDNVKPMVEVKSRRVGGATYQVPMEIREARREASIFLQSLKLPSEMSKSLVRFRHLVYIFLFLESCTSIIKGIHKLRSQCISHSVS